MAEHRAKATAGIGMNPATERLMSKITDLEEMLEGVQVPDLDPEKKHIVKICQTYIEKAREYIERPLLSAQFPFFGSRHPHLVWQLLHRVDEYFILLMKDGELHSTAIDVKTSFDLNIKEEKVRKEWIGEEGAEGKFKGVFEQIEKGQKITEEIRYMLKDALKIVNEQMDRTFWQLSMNTLTSVCSGTILGVLMLLAWMMPPEGALYSLGKGGLGDDFATLIVLGLMGAYLSNLMTREDFLYVRGGPFWRYLLHNLLSKPLMSSFAAVFIYILEKSKLIFSINVVTGSENPPQAVSQIISLNASQEGAGYLYAVLAVVSAFAADKVLRNMIDGVLKKLEQKAEKTKDTKKE